MLYSYTIKFSQRPKARYLVNVSLVALRDMTYQILRRWVDCWECFPTHGINEFIINKQLLIHDIYIWLTHFYGQGIFTEDVRFQFVSCEYRNFKLATKLDKIKMNVNI